MRTASALRFAALLFVPSLVGPLALTSPSVQDVPAGALVALPGERLGEDALDRGRIVDVSELHLLELERDEQSDFIHRARNGEQGVWAVPAMGASRPARSGTFYVINKWGDRSMGIAFGERVDLDGAWIAGQAAPENWTPGLRVLGFRDGVEVASTDWFESVGAEWTRFDIALADVDRVVFEARAVSGGAGWFAMDDFSFVQRGEGDSRERRVLDFEDLGYKTVLSGSGYAGLTWETGTGEFDETIRVIEQPLTHGEHDADEERQDGTQALAGGGGTAPTLVADFVGARLGDPGANFIPPDTCGAAGLNHFVEVVNTNYSVYLKSTGGRVVNISLGSFFGTGGSPGDPRVVFDPHSQRWFVLATNFSDRIFFAASLTSDPTGSFFTSSFLTSQGSDAGRTPDYPTLGVDANGVYVAAAMFNSTSATMTVFALEKAPLIGGSPGFGALTAFRGMGFEGAIQPCVTYGNPGREYLISRSGSSSLRLREVHPPLTSPTLIDRGNVSIPSHSFPPDAPALGSTTPLDSVDHRPMNAVYRNGSVWTTHGVGVNGRSAVRWYEIDPVPASTDQVGTINDSELSFIMPSIAVNANNDVVLGFTGSSPNQFAGAYYTGRAAGDPAGQTAVPVQYRTGQSSYTLTDGFGRNRWGDYSLTSVDPVDDLTFWTIQEYARSGGNTWGTWIAVLQYGFPDCNGNGVDDALDISSGTSQDCDANGVPDECQLDCDSDGVPDECETDCNGNGTPDDCESFADCDGNGVPDDCQPDCDGDGIPDVCEPDCDTDGIPDDCEIDCNGNGIPDECEAFADCNGNGIPDECDPDCTGNGVPDDCEPDCNGNGKPDDCELLVDCNSNGVPDDCDPDCDGDGIPDDCEPDCDGDGVPDDCEVDCNGNGTPDDCEPFTDCDGNGVPDECDPDCDGDGLPDACEADCNGNGTPDDCEAFTDCDGNGVPDECDPDCDGDGLPDACEVDCNGNGVPDECESFADCNANGVPDECDVLGGTSDDADGNGVPDECDTLGTKHCIGAPNSASPLGASVIATGSALVSDNDFTLTTYRMPNTFGIYFYGPNQIQQPFGDGFRCVGGAIQRVQPVMQASGNVLARTLDLGVAPHSSNVVPGATLSFQCWFRDPMGPGGSGFNLSDGVRVGFQ